MRTAPGSTTGAVRESLTVEGGGSREGRSYFGVRKPKSTVTSVQACNRCHAIVSRFDRGIVVT
jgi:hypothetical protein